MPSSQSDGPLAGVTVLGLENFLAGNHSTFLLSLLGADVIKVEHPEHRDTLRSIGPFREKDGRRRAASELRIMGNKRSIALDLQRPEGLEALFRLVRNVDVVYTNQKPESLKRMGITFESLSEQNAAIVYTTLSGFGHDDVVPSGPFGNWPAFDIIAQGLAGLQFRAEGEGDRPGYNGLPLGDEVTSMLAVLGTVSALYRRTVTGEAQRVDVAMHDSMVFANELALGTLSVLGRLSARGRSGTSQPYGSFRTADGWVNIAVGGDAIWRRFCEAIDRPELAHDERFATSGARVARVDELDALVEGWTTGLTTDQVVKQLHTKVVPCAPVYTVPEVLESEQAAAREMFPVIDDPIAGPTPVVGNPIKMTGLTSAAPTPPPDFAADTLDVLTALGGYSPDEVAALVEQGVTVTPRP